MSKRVRIQVIKVYEIEVEDNTDPYDLTTVEIEENGELIDASTDFAEEV